jgi:hypothetical protein
MFRIYTITHESANNLKIREKIWEISENKNKNYTPPNHSTSSGKGFWGIYTSVVTTDATGIFSPDYIQIIVSKHRISTCGKRGSVS